LALATLVLRYLDYVRGDRYYGRRQ
jgi:hypothetical protein